MKLRFALSLILFTTLSPLAFSQDKAVFMDAYIGGPQLLPTLTNNHLKTVKAKGSGPFGGKIEVLLHPRHSIGLDINYLQISFDSPLTFFWSENGGGHYSSGRHFTISKTRVYGRYAYHIVQKKKIDFYCYGAVGLAIWSKSQLRIEEVERDMYDNFISSRYVEFKNTFPLAVRTGVGARWFFSPHVGAHAEIGIGGALFTIGLSAKIPY